MKFNLSKAISVANALSSPKEAIGLGLNMLAKKNPEMAQTISRMIQSGEDPVKAIQKFSADGKFSQKELDQMKGIYNMAKKAGFKKFNVPPSVWEQAEQAIKAAPTSETSDWF